MAFLFVMLCSMEPRFFDRQQLSTLLSRLASAPGFVCFTRGDANSTSYSAWPVAQWRWPAGTADFAAVSAQILQAHGASVAVPGCGGVVGILDYEAGRATVPGFRSRRADPGTSGWAGLYRWQLTVRHDSAGTPLEGRLDIHPQCPQPLRKRLAALAPESAAATPRFHLTEPFQPCQSADQYRRGVARILELIHAGDCYQANLSQQFQARYQGHPWAAYLALTRAIPVPHGAYIDTGMEQVLSISPEMFLRIRGNEVISRPIKGTRPRGATAAEDQAQSRELQASIKDRAENLMIVDLIRNDLSRFCIPHSVRVPALFAVESYRNVHQLVSTVSGRLSTGTTPLEALLSAFPGGSITGAPKRRAMEIIDQLEPHRRGPYCGSAFWWDHGGDLDSNIAIRTLRTTPDQRILAWAGCGIVADSDPEAEYQESLVKIGRLMETLQALPATAVSGQ